MNARCRELRDPYEQTFPNMPPHPAVAFVWSITPLVAAHVWPHCQVSAFNMLSSFKRQLTNANHRLSRSLPWSKRNPLVVDGA